MKKVILQQAFEELNDAVEHYEEEQAGLGLRMMDEIDKHVQRQFQPTSFMPWWL